MLRRGWWSGYGLNDCMLGLAGGGGVAGPNSVRGFFVTRQDTESHGRVPAAKAFKQGKQRSIWSSIVSYCSVSMAYIHYASLPHTHAHTIPFPLFPSPFLSFPLLPPRSYICPCPSSSPPPPRCSGSNLINVSIRIIATHASTALFNCLTLLILGSSTPALTQSCTFPLLRSSP